MLVEEAALQMGLSNLSVEKQEGGHGLIKLVIENRELTMFYI